MFGRSKGLLLSILFAALTLAIGISSAQEYDDVKCVPYPRCLSTQRRYIYRIANSSDKKKSNWAVQEESRSNNGDNKGECSCVRLGRATAISGIRSTCISDPECEGHLHNVRNRFPWMVHVAKMSGKGKDLSTICSGALLNQLFILTAAHCVEIFTRNVSKLRVIVGDNGNVGGSPITLKARTVTLHSNHSENDIALIRLMSNLKFNGNITPICLPSQGIDLHAKKGVALAWSNTTGLVELVESNVIITSGARCANNYENLSNTKITRKMLCADLDEEEGPLSNPVCKGNSGGPLMVWNNNRYEIKGVAIRYLGCGDEFRSPSTFVDVSKYMKWIADRANLECTNCKN